jgi:hypothetical protein
LPGITRFHAAAEDPHPYEWVGPIAMRIDALERVLVSLPDARRLEQAFDHLGLDSALRALVLKHLRRGRTRA